MNQKNRRFSYLELGFDRIIQPMRVGSPCTKTYFGGPEIEKTHKVLVGPKEVNQYGYRWVEYLDRERSRICEQEEYKMKRRCEKGSHMNTIGIAWKEYFLKPPTE